ncbi:MAG: hypothetical protein QNL18_09300 [Pseudomonadales bacterium]
MDRGWLPAVTSAAALSVYGFACEGGSPTLYLAAYRKPYGWPYGGHQSGLAGLK